MLLRLVILLTVLLTSVEFAAADRGQKRSSKPTGIRTAARTISDTSNMSLLDNFFGEGDHGLLLLRHDRREMSLYRLIDGEFRHIQRANPWGPWTKAATYVYKGVPHVAVGYDYTKSQAPPRNPNAKNAKIRYRLKKAVKLVLYDPQLDNEQVLFEERTDEGGITVVKSEAGRLFFGILHNEDFSKGGWIDRRKNTWEFNKRKNTWKFNRRYGGRYQEHIDVWGEEIAVGSSKSDVEERAQELRIKKGDDWLELPSVRGVSALAYVQADDDPEKELLVADGLPNARTKRAKSQLGLINRSGEEYSRETVAFARGGQDKLDSLVPFYDKGRLRVLAKGWKFITLFLPEEDWKSIVVYRKEPENAKLPLDFALFKQTEDELLLAVLEAGEVFLLKCPLQ